jgi:hypothetical protein
MRDAAPRSHTSPLKNALMKREPATESLVRRRCLVCDTEDELVEPSGEDEIGPACPICVLGLLLRTSFASG